MPLPLPVWPAWHTMPAPPEIRWSYEAWEACYPVPWAHWWKPWPWEPEPKPHPTGAEVWEAVQEFYRTLPKSVPLAQPLFPLFPSMQAEFDRLRQEIAYSEHLRRMLKARRAEGAFLDLNAGL